jgi:hypothetical protein
MALKLGTAMQEAGSYVTLFVDLEGVRVADSRQPQHLRWGDGAPVLIALRRLGSKRNRCGWGPR